MTLGEIIRDYRTRRNISQREFSKLSGLSNSYISQLERNRNTKNGLPITSISLVTIKQVADAMETPLDSILRMMDDAPVNISEPPEDDLSVKIYGLVCKLPEELQLSLYDLLRAAVDGARTR